MPYSEITGEFYEEEYEDDSSCDDSYSCDCPDCRDDSDEESDDTVINSYSYRPMPVFYGQGPLFLGVELEVETEDRHAAAAEATNGFGKLAYLKQDGSLNYGFEIVTHPMSPEYAIQSANWETLRAIRSVGGRINPENNGLHVHVSRTGFRCDSHAFNWLKLYYRNQDMVSRIARRDSQQWAGFNDYARKAHKRTAKLSPDWLSRRDSQNAGRYQAINTLPDSTFELRMFASTLRPERVKGTLAFVTATIEYTRELSASRVMATDGWAWRSFTSWLRANDTDTLMPAITYLESVCAF